MSTLRMANVPRCTSRFVHSTGHFLRVALGIFTQLKIKVVLYENYNFNFKFNVPEGFLGCGS